MTAERETAMWVMPHWTNDFSRSRRHLEAAVGAVFDQTDSDWELVIVDDGTDDAAALAYLRALAKRCPKRVHVILEPSNRGAGAARNVGVRLAAARRSPFVVFLDADDLSRPGRLAAVRAAFADGSAPGVVYSTFDVVDPDGRPVPLPAMTGSVAEVIEAHRRGPPQGLDVWIAIGTDTGYVNHTSSTAVRTDIAHAHPFPDVRVSEDAHTWLRYSAAGAPFAHLDEPWSSYRTTTDEAGSSSRTREGGQGWVLRRQSAGRCRRLPLRHRARHRPRGDRSGRGPRAVGRLPPAPRRHACARRTARTRLRSGSSGTCGVGHSNRAAAGETRLDRSAVGRCER
jgi:hypothetical protein